MARSSDPYARPHINGLSGRLLPDQGFKPRRNPLGRTPRRRTTLPSQLLFVPNEDGTISIYPLDDPSTPVAQITGLQASQQGMVVDASGNLFVVNNGASAGDDYVLKYAPPHRSADDPQHGLAKQYLLSGRHCRRRTGNGLRFQLRCVLLRNLSVFVYPSRSTSPAKAITSSSFNSLAGLFSDAPGNLYIVNWNDQTYGVDVFRLKAGSTNPKALKLHGLVTGNGGNGVALDVKGDLYVANNLERLGLRARI